MSREPIPAVRALVDSAERRRLVEAGRNRDRLRLGYAAAAAIPLVMGLHAEAGNRLAGWTIADPLAVDLGSAAVVLAVPLVAQRGRALYAAQGPNLFYSAERDLVTRASEHPLNASFGFEPALLGSELYPLRENEAQVMPVRTGARPQIGESIEALVGSDEVELRVPTGVFVREGADGIGVVKREKNAIGARFALLAHAPYGSIRTDRSARRA